MKEGKDIMPDDRRRAAGRIYTGLAILVLCTLLSCKSNQPYLSVESTYVQNHLTNEIKPHQEVFLFSDYAFYTQDKVYACEFLRETRNRKVWRIGWTYYEFKKDEMKLHRNYRIKNDYRNPSIRVASYLVKQ